MPVADDETFRDEFLTVQLGSHDRSSPLKMSTLFEATLEEIFNKFDVKQTGVLDYDLMKAFADTVGR